MTSVTEIRKDWSDRLNELSQLSGSWDAGYLAATPMSASLAREILARLSDTDAKIGIYPTLVGGLQLEWNDNVGRYSVLIGRSGMIETRRSQRFVSVHPVSETRTFTELSDVFSTIEEWTVRL